MPRGGTAWHIDGGDLADSLFDVEADVAFPSDAIERIYEDPSVENMEKLARAMECSRKATDELKMILCNKKIY